MTRQDVVRALVADDRVEEVLDMLGRDLEIDRGSIEVTEPEPATYREEGSNLEVHWLVRATTPRIVIGAVAGAALGAVVALLVPALRDLAPISVVLLAFGFGWGAAAVMAARGVQTARHEGSRGEELHAVDAAESERVSLLTIRNLHDRTRLIDRLAEMGAILLDSDYPEVGRGGSGQRPADRGVDDAGPPAG